MHATKPNQSKSKRNPAAHTSSFVPKSPLSSSGETSKSNTNHIETYREKQPSEFNRNPGAHTASFAPKAPLSSSTAPASWRLNHATPPRSVAELSKNRPLIRTDGTFVDVLDMGPYHSSSMLITPPVYCGARKVKYETN
jgi:hypothetical protein